MADNNNPIIAAVLSFFIPGLGQYLINKKAKKGVAFFFGTLIGYIFLIIPGVIVWLFNIYDAYMEAQGKPVWKFD
jgi:TM2 domain-containing membrane protein YozV